MGFFLLTGQCDVLQGGSSQQRVPDRLLDGGGSRSLGSCWPSQRHAAEVAMLQKLRRRRRMRMRRRRRCSCIIARHMTKVNGCAWGQVHTRAFPSQLDKNESPTRAQFLHPHPWSHLAPQAPAVAAHPRETEPSNTPPHQRRQEPTGVAVDAREGGGKEHSERRDACFSMGDGLLRKSLPWGWS
jgi:hypothetical protein